jgi:undecaprenyl-diphosphatase
MSFWSSLVRLDQSLFQAINTGCSNPFFDSVMPFLRNSLHWAPLYLFVLTLVILNFKTRGIWWLVFFLVTIALTDMTGTYLLKHLVQRPRPCNDPMFFEHVRLVIDKCAGGYSFISNHAANHFGMATFFFITFRRIIGPWVFNKRFGFPTFDN